MSIVHDPDETRAIALVAMSLGYALAGMLKRVSVLDPEAMENTLETALSSMEGAFPADDQSALLARQLLDLMGAQLAAHVEPLRSCTNTDGRRPKRRVAPTRAVG